MYSRIHGIPGDGTERVGGALAVERARTVPVRTRDLVSVLKNSHLSLLPIGEYPTLIK
jgi:hypothetical protein